MYDQAEFSYGLSVRARNMVVRLYINGAPVAFHSSLREMSYYASVARYLRAGTNTIVIDYEPIDPVERSFTPTPDMQVFVELDQSRKSVRQGRIDVFHGRFDTERQSLRPSEEHLLTGEPLVTEAGSMAIGAVATIEPVDMNYPDRESGLFARRLTMDLRLSDDSLGTLPQDGAMPLEDTPELRDRLYEAYRALHTAFMAEDAQTYGRIMSHILDRFAYVRGFAGRQEDVLRHQIANNPLGGAEGETIRPLASRRQFDKAPLLWGANRRMVALADGPITYLDAEGRPAGGVGVMFCQHEDGSLFACHQQ